MTDQPRELTSQQAVGELAPGQASLSAVAAKYTGRQILNGNEFTLSISFFGDSQATAGPFTAQTVQLYVVECPGDDGVDKEQATVDCGGRWW